MKLFNGTRSAAAVLGLLAATTLTACGSDDSAAVASDYDPIVIGVGVDATYAPFFLAESEGMFEDAGLDVTLQQFSAGGLAVDAIAGKEVQIAAASPATMVAKQASNAELRSLFKYFTSDATIGVVGNEDVSDAADIETFGVMPGVSQYDAYKYLQSEGVDPEGVKFEVVQDPSTLPPLTQKGDLDAYVLWEPWVTNGVGLGLQLLASTGSFGQPAEQVVTADATWLEGHEEEMALVAEVLRDAAEDVQEDKEAGATATNSEAPAIATEDALAALEKIDFGVTDLTDEDVASVEDVADYFVSLGTMESAPDMRSAMLTGWTAQHVE